MAKPFVFNYFSIFRLSRASSVEDDDYDYENYDENYDVDENSQTPRSEDYEVTSETSQLEATKIDTLLHNVTEVEIESPSKRGENQVDKTESVVRSISIEEPGTEYIDRNLRNRNFYDVVFFRRSSSN